MIARLIFLFLSPAHAHLVGMSPWCIASSPVHYECFYSDPKECEAAAKKNSNLTTQYQCLPYPIDFRNIPKSGEEPVKPTK